MTLSTIACQAPLSRGFSRQEYCSGLQCHPPGDLPEPRIKLASPATPSLQADSISLSHQRRSVYIYLTSLVAQHKGKYGESNKETDITMSKINRSVFPGGTDGKNLPAMQETHVQSLDQEGPYLSKIS